MLRRMRKFFRTPKGLLLIVLAIFTAVAAPGEGVHAVLSSMGTPHSPPVSSMC